jgi:hypothetical protein
LEIITSQLPEIFSSNKTENQRKYDEVDRINNALIGFEALNIKTGGLSIDFMSKSVNEVTTTKDVDKVELPKAKPVPAEKPSSSNLDRRKFPIAAPRNLTNITSNQQGFINSLFYMNSN